MSNISFLNVSSWTTEQVAKWMKGLHILQLRVVIFMFDDFKNCSERYYKILHVVELFCIFNLLFKAIASYIAFPDVLVPLTKN